MKTLSQSFVIATCFATAFTACGGEEDKGYGDPIGGAVEQEAATGAIDSLYSLRAFQDTGGTDELALASVTLGFVDVSSLLSAKLVAEAGQGQQQYLLQEDQLFQTLNNNPAPVAVAIGESDTASALGDECIVVTDDTVTYNDCTWLYGRIDGWITVRGDHLSFDLQLDYGDTSFDYTIRMDGSVEVSETRVVGNFDYEIDASFGGSVVQYELDGDFDVALAEGCPVGGYLEIHGSVSATSNAGSSGGWDGWVRAEYGPSCGQVRIF
jgi:hypothetical protein